MGVTEEVDLVEGVREAEMVEGRGEGWEGEMVEG